MKTAKFSLKQVAEEQGVKNPFELSNRTGINYATCYSLWEGNVKRIDLKTLTKLCEYFQVTPNELLGYTNSVKKV
ncbi:MAG: helix-turn-helix domain-containing protein [Candidatus Electronema sp. VV]